MVLKYILKRTLKNFFCCFILLCVCLQKIFSYEKEDVHINTSHEYKLSVAKRSRSLGCLRNLRICFQLNFPALSTPIPTHTYETSPSCLCISTKRLCLQHTAPPSCRGWTQGVLQNPALKSLSLENPHPNFPNVEVSSLCLNAVMAPQTCFYQSNCHFCDKYLLMCLSFIPILGH